MPEAIISAKGTEAPTVRSGRFTERVTAIETWQREVENRLDKLEAGSPTEPGELEEPADEWPEYKQPTGAHDAYHVGDKITYNGKHYTCVYDGCVWTPDAYPQGWQEES